MHAPSTGRPSKNPRTKKSILGKQYQKYSRHYMAKSFPWMQLMIATVVELRPAGSSPGVLSAQSENALLNDSFTLVRNVEIIHVQDFRMSSSWIRRLVPVSMFCGRFQLLPRGQNRKGSNERIGEIAWHKKKLRLSRNIRCRRFLF
jgi:hypothetical protein